MLAPLWDTLIQQQRYSSVNVRSQPNRRGQQKGPPNIPFFFEGESLSWLLEGVEVVTLGGRTSRGSVGVRGLPGGMMSSESSGIKGVIVVIGVRGFGLTIVHTEEEEEEMGLSPLSISVSMASELRMTRKWVLAEGVMVTFFMSSSFSFLETWILKNNREKRLPSIPRTICLPT